LQLAAVLFALLAGFDVETDSADVGIPETIPNEADFLLGLATVPGFVSYRSRSQGSWYITTLVRLLDEYAHRSVF
jgi:hypothetical protein